MEGQLALITGAGRGIGRAIAVRLGIPTELSPGMPVVLVSRTSEEIDDIRNEIIEHGGKAFATPCDVRNPSEVKALAEDVLNELGPLTVLINNAGITSSAKFSETTDEMWRDTFAVNVDGAFYVTRAFLPGMKANGGSVVAIASTAALEGFRFTSAYTASKHALLGLMRALAKEFENTGITFNTICPGFTRTQILAEAIQSSMDRGHSMEKAEAMFAMMNREGRIIEPEEIAEAVYQIINDRNLPSGRAYHSDGTVIAQ